ncbi:ATP synthase complex assembly protein atp12 [Tulasnella sp. 330]|nr:ATP synthase complex assembly protein atp12 [Tulasnella sp. 330]KAG8884323.1 ATP synthase complex assembly protein atp12 [Tulasnella sp. 331]KAG8886726.1 ATP synthase complex assembly protein atp12 [Tulasnella sp. 332]
MYRLTFRQSSVIRSASTSRYSGIQCRWQATVATSVTPGGVPVTQTNRAETGMKKFWKEANLTEDESSFTVLLDKRALKTPSGNVLKLPRTKRLAATLVAQEWENQETLLKTHTLPMTSLVARAIDGLSTEKERAEVRVSLMKYLATDTICFHQDKPPALVRLQEKHWDPILESLQKALGVDIKIHKALFASGQNKNTTAALLDRISTFDQWQLAAFERSVYATKSFLVSLALVTQRLSVEEASTIANVEVLSQIETWGMVEDTHDVDECDIRRQLGSATCLLVDV